MKKATLLFIATLLGANVFSQSTCESFDNIPQSKLKSNGGLDGAHAFHVYGNLSNGGCSGTGTCYYDKWEVVNGAPSIFWYNQISGVMPANDSNYVCLNTNGNSNPQKTDGLAYMYNFTAGNTYTVSMALRTLVISGSTTNLNIEFYLLQNALPYTYVNTIGASSIATVPSGALKVSTKANFVNNTGWTTVSFQIPASLLTNNYSRLWIRQTNNANAGDLGLLLDSFCISKDNVSGVNIPMESNSIATLYQNYPNPFDKETTISYFIPEKSGKVDIQILDLAGRLVQTYPINSTGQGSITIDNNQLQNGSYMYSLYIDQKMIQSNRMVVNTH